MGDYTYLLVFSKTTPEGGWQILDISDVSFSEAFGDERKVVFRCPTGLPGQEDGLPPEPLRKKYEELLGRPEFIEHADSSIPNIVELVAEAEDCAWDQPCKFGHRVDTHAVYCHNKGWLYAPRKCRRNRTDYLHESCRGFKVNPEVK